MQCTKRGTAVEKSICILQLQNYLIYLYEILYEKSELKVTGQI